ncbi:MAG: hypothetical protein ABSG15_08625 [FCB group bacterium]
MQSKALAQLRTRTSLLGKDGAFAPLFKQFISSALFFIIKGYNNIISSLTNTS